jgi:hypothetical protein
MRNKLIKLAWTFNRAGAVVGVIVGLLCRAALGQTIPNPSFEADTFTNSPGYISTNAAITGWTGTPPERVGLNSASGPFADNGTIPAGNNVAFIQANSTDPGTVSTLSTTISGLTVGTTYKVMFRANARGGNTPNVKIYIDGAAVLLPGVDGFSTAAVTGSKGYWHVAFEFTAAAASQTLSLVNDATGDQTLLVDDFKIAPTSGKWTVDAWTGDADSGVDSQYLYTHAYNFGSSANTTINGVTFTGLTGGNPSVSGKFTTDFLPNVFNPDANNLTPNGDGSAVLAASFIYGGNVPADSYQTIALQGLTAGTEYVITVYSVGFDDPSVGSRWATFNVGDDYLTVNQDQYGNNAGIRLAYRYTADTNGTMTFKYAPLVPANVSFHTYGFSNRKAVSGHEAPTISAQPKSVIVSPDVAVSFSVVAVGVPTPAYQWRFKGAALADKTDATLSLPTVSAADAGGYDVIVSNVSGVVTSAVAQLTVGIVPIINPSFEVDSFSVYPGYVSGNFPITGWTTLGGHGINPAGSSPFADNGTIPHGSQVLFMQTDGTASQVLSGFTVGAQYYVHYYENARTGPTIGMEVKVGGSTVLAAHSVSSVGGANPYYEMFSDVFVASATDLELAFVKSSPQGGDCTALIDNVAILPVAAGTPPSITLQPKPVTVYIGSAASFTGHAIGSSPVNYQWYLGGVPVAGATSNVLTLAAVKFADEGNYTLVVTNNYGAVTSSVAPLSLLETIPSLHNTGVDASGAVLAGGATDPFWTLQVNPDGGSTNVYVGNDGFPTSWLANSTTSKWVGPRASLSDTNIAQGDYRYRTTVDLTGRDINTVIIVGQWASDNWGGPVSVNGTTVNVPGSFAFNGWTTFTLASTNATFLPGINTIDFVVNNLSAGSTGLRVEFTLASARTLPGIPAGISKDPQGATVGEGDTVALTVNVTGTLPVSYQWKKNGVDLPGKTDATLTLTAVTTNDAGLYRVGVSNAWGSAVSSNAAVVVAYLAVPGVYGTGVTNDGTLLPGGSVDPHYILSVSADLNFPGPNAMVLSNVYPIGTWLVNGPKSSWIAPQTDQSGTDHGDGTYGGNAEGDYTYETSFILAAADLNKVQIVGAWACDNEGTNILVNGASTGLNNGAGFGSLTPFMITVNNGLVAGQNILDFVVHNDPVTPNPTGLRIDLRGLLPIGFTPYSLDMNTPAGSSLHASDGTEPLDNWWANEFTAVAGGNVITEVDFGCGTVTAGSFAVASLYRVTGTGGDPALGAVRLYSQTFKPIPGSTGQPNLNKITLTSPVALNVGDRFLVAISMTNVIALAPNDVYPFPIDKTTNSTGSYWDRSAPNTFNLDDLSQAKPINQALAAGGYVPGDSGGHLYIRAIGTPVTTTGPTLKIRLSSGSAVISWSPNSAGQQLNSAPTPNGPWKAITGAPNPYTTPLGATNTFYRVSQ